MGAAIMCICASEFYKWLRAFKVVTGGGNANLSYGEMVITNNSRATNAMFPSLDWVKVEAGDPLAPTSPPDYSLYGPGDLKNWEFDSANARLVYIGTKSGYYEVRASLSALMADGAGTFISFALRKNDNTDDELTTKSIMPFTARVGLSLGDVVTGADSVSLQASGFFETNDYIDIVVQNNSDSDLPLVHTMNYFVSSVGDASAPLQPVFIISNEGDFFVDNNGDFIIAEE
jgi:hypothetical protein